MNYGNEDGIAELKDLSFQSHYHMVEEKMTLVKQYNAVTGVKNQLVDLKKHSPARDYEQNISFIINK